MLNSLFVSADNVYPDTPLDSLLADTANVIVERTLTPEGDTIYSFKWKAYDYGELYENAPVKGKTINDVTPLDTRVRITSAPVNRESYSVGEIPFSESVSPSGGLIYSIPIASAPQTKGAPQIAVGYNSQGGNSVAGYGWSISGVSGISVIGKTIHYDNVVAPIDISKPESCVFALDGVRLINYSGDLLRYDYETASGFILVEKHLAGSHVAYFTVAYPNGSTATFGFKDNTSTQLTYPITELTDAQGFKTNYYYIHSGNAYYVSRITYGGRSVNDYQAEMMFNYADRTDYTEGYVSGQAVRADKLLKEIVSRNSVAGTMHELRTYRLKHSEGEVNRLVQLDCSSGEDKLRPLCFEYEFYDHDPPVMLTGERAGFISEYFSTNPINETKFLRGKLVPNQYSDGFISYVGKYSTYDVVGVKVKRNLFLPSKEYLQFGSTVPESQEILLIPKCDLIANVKKIKAESGFQNINAVDINGDGTDDVIKVNFGTLNGDYTTLNITKYKNVNSEFVPDMFTIPVKGVVNNEGETYSPMSRIYLYGDFRGTGKPLLLTVSHDRDFLGRQVHSQFAVIDLETKAKLSEENLFQLSHGDSQFLLPLDIDGDGKAELCHINNYNTDVYDFDGVRFVKRNININLGRSNFTSSYDFADLNADGKIDILTAPPLSRYELYMEGSPVWLPRNCPKCRQSYPVEDIRSQECTNCHVNIVAYLLVHPFEAECIVCGNKLMLINNEIPPNPVEGYYDPAKKRLACYNHGTHIDEPIHYYIDNGNTWTAFLSTGTGFVKQEMTITTFDAGAKKLLMDMNGDGHADLILTKDTKANLYLNSRGTLLSEVAATVNIPAYTDIIASNVCDIRNMSHFIMVENAKVNCYSYRKLFDKDNLLTKLTDSYGNSHINTYSDMIYHDVNNNTNGNISYPYCYAVAPLNLLVNSSTYSPHYQQLSGKTCLYQGAVINRAGLGFICFEKIKTIDNISNTTTEEFHDPNKFGVTIRTDSPARITRHSYSKPSPYDKRNNIQLLETVDTDKLTTITQTTHYQYDGYNNVINKHISYGYNNKIRHNIKNNVKNVITNGRYVIGLVTESEVTKYRGNAAHKEKETITYNSAFLPERRVTYINDNKSGDTRWSYDIFGNITNEKHAPYNVTTMLETSHTYDDTGRFITSSTNELGQTTTYSNFDKYGNACVVSDYKARKTRRTFDAWGRMTSATHADGVIEKTEYSWGGRELYTVRTDVTGKPSAITHYDSMGREIRKGTIRFDGRWQFVDKAYDARGRLARQSLPFRGDTPKYWNTYTYDNYNRPVSFTEAQGRTTSWSYNGINTTETKNGITTTKTVDASGALVKTEDAGGRTTYELRPDGQPSSVTAPGGILTTFGYDEFGRRTSIDDPSAGIRTYTDNYNPDGTRNQTETDAAGNTITTTSDIYGRVIRVERPEFNTDYSYDPDGRLISEISTNGVRQMYFYDEFDRLQSEEKNVDDLSFAKSYTYADGLLKRKHIVTYSYMFSPSMFSEEYIYQNGHLVEIRIDDGTAIWKLQNENDLGQPVEVMTGPLKRTYDYTYFGMPSRRTAGSIQDFAYNFNPHTGNLMSRTDNLRNKSESFSYDNLDRLQSINSTGISYAQNGNITQMPNGGTLSYDDEDRPYQVTSLTPIAESPLASDQTVSYTSFQRPSTIAQDGLECSFDYDAGGDRVKMSFSRTDSDRGDNSTYYLDEYEYHSSSGRRILYLGGDAYSAPAVLVRTPMSTGWSLYYICRDYLGSITHIAYSSGELKQELSYDAWGHLRNPDTHEVYAQGEEPELFLNRGYTGHEHLQQFGLINMNARLYDPVLGRFLSPDPYVQMPDFSQSFNRYSYCMNNPLKYVDKDGEFPFLIVGGIIIGAYLGGTMANKGELNPLSWNWKDATTYLGIGFGAIMGYTASYGFLNPGTIGYTFGINNSWGAAALTVGGTSLGSEWSFSWTTAAGGGGQITNKDFSSSTINRKIDRSISDVREEWDNSAFVYSNIAASTLALDDATVIGIADDFLIPIIYATASTYWLYSNQELIGKRTREIAHLVQSNLTLKQGFTYELRPKTSGYYRNVHGGSVYLTPDDVWKYGETTRGFNRYNDNSYENRYMNMYPIYYGNQMEIKIYEKIMIYGYYFKHGHLPPGNKIFR